MPSSIRQETHNKPGVAPKGCERLKLWNRRLHYYAGLYLLFFAWLFAFTGLLLNHPQWKFAEFWENRKQSTRERDIVAPASGGDLAQAREIMAQLGIRGEIEWTATRGDARQFSFRVSRPGHLFEIKADLGQNRAFVQQIDLNAWGKLRILHTFTGVRLDDLRNRRDWVFTSLWALAMDALAVGLIAMVLSSFFMWFELPAKRLLGSLVLLAGFGTCGLFWFGLRMLY